MCQIAYVKKGAKIDLNLIPQIMVHNQDGVGIMWQGKNTVHMLKGFLKPTEVMRATRLLSENNIVHCIHWRKATIGNINELNIHPFEVLKEPVSGLEIYGMMNGTLSQSQIPINNDDDCDARLMMTDILAPILKNKPSLIRDAAFTKLVEQAIGIVRIVLMTPREVVVINEEKGYWKDDVWFSNKYSNNPVKKPSRTTYYSGNTTNYYGYQPAYKTADVSWHDGIIG